MIHKKLLSLLVLLMMTVSMSAKVPYIQISVTVPTGNSITLDVTPNYTIGDVKETIEQQTLIPSELQILTFNNQVLVDEQSVGYYDIEDDPTLTLSLVSGNYYLNGGSTDNCTVSFKVGDNENAGTAQEGDEVTVTFTPTAPYVLTAVTAQAYTTWAGARRAEPEPTPTIPVLGDITLTPVEGQANTYTFTMPPSHVKFTTTLRQPSGLAWTLGGNELADGATVNYCKGFPFTAPVLFNPNGLHYQFEVEGAGISLDDNTAVTVDDQEAQPGTYTITVSYDDDGTYQATTVTYNLVISEPAILSVAADPTTGGTVEVVIPESGVIDNQDGTYNVIPGTSVTLKATAANGYQLNSWSQNVTADTDDNTVATITVDATATATAYFGEKEYEVDLTVNGDDDQGTEKALWTGKAGEQGTAKNFPITAKTGQAVTISYNGRRKVKAVTATTDAEPETTYLKWDAEQEKLVATEIPATAKKVENTDVEWAAGTYLVDGNVTINGGIELMGDVELIIKDGAKLTANYIYGDNHNLNIYGQANKSGELNVACSDGDAISNLSALNIHSCKVNASSLFVTCGGFYGIGELNVYGGSVDAKYTGDSKGYGLCDISSLNIWRGEMKAEGKGTGQYSYGITYWVNVTNVTVYGGKLWVKSADSKALDPDNEVTFTKDPSYDGVIETSDDGTEWNDHEGSDKPDAKYVRVGY